MCLLAAPFSRDGRALAVPWESHTWFWRRYEIYFSHLGIPFALCAIAAPFAAFGFRRSVNHSESLVVTFAAIAAFILMLPVLFRPPVST